MKLDIGKIELALNEDDLRNLSAKYGASLEAGCEGKRHNGCAWHLAYQGNFVYIIYLNTDDFHGEELNQKQLDFLYLTLVHEAVHVKQFYLSGIHEEHCGDEIEAYLVESILETCLKKLRKRIKSWKIPPKKIN